MLQYLWMADLDNQKSMKEFEPNIIVITEAEAKWLFINARGMQRSDKRKEREGLQDSFVSSRNRPIEPNHPMPSDASKRLKIMEGKQ